MPTVIRFRIAETQPDKAVRAAVDAQLRHSLPILPPSVPFVCPLWHRGPAVPPKPAGRCHPSFLNWGPAHGRLRCALWTTPSNSDVIAR